MNSTQNNQLFDLLAKKILLKTQQQQLQQQLTQIATDLHEVEKAVIVASSKLQVSFPVLIEKHDIRRILVDSQMNATVVNTPEQKANEVADIEKTLQDALTT